MVGSDQRRRALEPCLAASQRSSAGSETSRARRESNSDPAGNERRSAARVRVAFLVERGLRKARLLFAVRTGTVLSLRRTAWRVQRGLLLVPVMKRTLQSAFAAAALLATSSAWAQNFGEK